MHHSSTFPFISHQCLEVPSENTSLLDQNYRGIRKNRSYTILNRLKRVPSFTQRSIQELNYDNHIDQETSTLVAGWNVSNLIQGIGILGIPFSVYLGGWVAVFFNFVFAAMCCFTGILLIDCFYVTCPITNCRTRVGKSFSCIADRVWPQYGKQMVNIISIIEMFGGLTLYNILLAKMFYVLLHPVAPSMDLYLLAIVCTGAALPLLFTTRMSIISWFSVTGVVALIGTIVCIIVFSFLHIEDMRFENMPNLDFNKVPVSLGIILFSYCAHAIYPAVEGSMKKPEEFSCMLKFVYTIAAILKTFIGLVPVFIFGSETQEEITANMVVNWYLSTAISILVFVTVFFSIPLVAYVISERIDAILLPYFHETFERQMPSNWIWISLTRSILLCSSLLTFMLIPHFSLLMGLLGSITGTCLSFVFPCWFHIVLKWNSLTRFQIVCEVIVAIIGGIIGITGAYYAAIEIFMTFE